MGEGVWPGPGLGAWVDAEGACGDVSVRYAAFVGLLLPAASVSQTARVHVPAFGIVIAAGPFGGAVAGWVHELGLSGWQS